MPRPAAIRCAACGATALRPRFRVRGATAEQGLIPTTKQFGTALGDIVRCRACGHMQLDRLPTEAELAQEYARAASHDYLEEEAGQRAGAHRVLRRVERYAPRGALLDVGCWAGFLMASARDRGWEPSGIEPSEFASRYARDRLGLDVRTGDLFNTELEPARFNAVVLGDVLEHLPPAGEALERIAPLLSPAGVLVLLMPDAGSAVARLLGRRWWSVIPTHVHYFTRRSVLRLLARHGFRPLYVGTDPKVFSVRYYLEKGSGYSPRLSRALVHAADRAGIAERMWAPDFRDRMMVVARPEARSRS